MSEEKTISPEMAFTIISTLRDQIEIQKMRIRKLKQQKQQREELLKECFEYIDWTSGIGSPISQQKLLNKIDEALK
jgi:hypothetical protein